MEKRCVVVTGGNKGIGFEICRQLASNEIRVVLTARNESRGVKAVEELNSSGLTDVVFHQLDVKDPTSVARLAKFIETQFKKLDILINNAAESGVILATERRSFENGGGSITENMVETYEMGEECLETNYYGTKKVTVALLPLLQLSNSPRIVNVSSTYGELHWIQNEKVKTELQDIDNLTEDRIDEIIQLFFRDFKVAKLSKNGWPVRVSAYKVSKIAISAYTRIMARKFPNILVNCVHPGFVKTDFTFNIGDITPEEGAKAPVMVALLPNDGPSGVYFKQMQMAPF